jgi:hypothetical protein
MARQHRQFLSAQAVHLRFRADFPTPPRPNSVAPRPGRESSPMLPGLKPLPEPVPWQAKRRTEGKNKSAAPKISDADESRWSVRIGTPPPIFHPLQVPDYSEGNIDYPLPSLRPAWRSGIAWPQKRAMHPMHLTFSNILMDGQVCRKIPVCRHAHDHRRQSNEANQVVI